jgi:hypothetical protein
LHELLRQRTDFLGVGFEADLILVHALSRAVKDLSAIRFAFLDDLGDLGIVEVEHFAQDEDRAFEWRELLQHQQKCK